MMERRPSVCCRFLPGGGHSVSFQRLPFFVLSQRRKATLRALVIMNRRAKGCMDCQFKSLLAMHAVATVVSVPNAVMT